jgi:hypothetical protein
MTMHETHILKELLHSPEPAIRLKTYVKLLDHDYETKEVSVLLNTLKEASEVITQLFAHIPKQGEPLFYGVYHKWFGIHWLLYVLADLGYPPGDSALIPSRNHELDWLLGDKHWGRTLTINGRKRFCASMEGNAVFSLIQLEMDDGRCSHLVDRLMKYQWPDGGWNCDKNPTASHSSYHESLIPLRGLAAYAKRYPNPALLKTIDQAVEVFLKRHLYQRSKTAEPIHPTWLKLCYPPYWHYNYLMALKVLAEAHPKILQDRRCEAALDLLEAKQLPGGGFPAEMRYYKGSGTSNISPVQWGGVNKRNMNPWVTIDALYVLKQAHRIDLNF